jgi:hypothetical protein
MKKVIYSILLIALAFLIFLGTYFLFIQQKPPVLAVKADTVVQRQEKIVFLVVAKDVDFNTMATPDIVKQIEADSMVTMKSTGFLDVGSGTKVIKVYKVEDITCPYLKKRFRENKPGEMVYEYNGKMLVKCTDGVIKVYHGHSPREEKAGQN